MVEQSPNLAPWRAVVTQAAAVRIALTEWHPDPRAPMHLHAVFTVARPQSHWRTGKHSDELRDSAPTDPVTRPDLDKLIRSTMDALVDAGAMTDDARVTYVAASKVYPGGHIDALDSPGAVLTLMAW
jgi:crossover junction endodeoxyribonuclease RusA